VSDDRQGGMVGVLIQIFARHVTTGLGAIGVTVGPDTQTQVAGALALLASVGYAIYAQVRERRRARKGA
jgi:hypothetical protein